MVFKGEEMNLGFFLQTNAGTPRNTKIYNFLNDGVKACNIDNASVFFNDIGFNPVSPKFGMFSSANLWSFKGNLICTSIDNLRKAVNIVNDIKIAYLFSSEEDNVERNIYDFIAVAKQFDVITDNAVDQNTFYRLTGVKPKLVEEWSLEKLGEIFDE